MDAFFVLYWVASLLRNAHAHVHVKNQENRALTATFGFFLAMTELTERDECAFHEMMVHLPLFSHPQPKHVLIVGGGDGVCLREVCRHPEVEKVTLVEIDPIVLHASREHLKLVPGELLDGSDSRVEIVHEDAAEFLKADENRDRFDAILADTLDPIGPAESLFEPEFYEQMHAALKPSGIMCIQGESFFIHLDLIRDLVAVCRDLFDSVEYATTMAPSYPCTFFLIERQSTRCIVWAMLFVV